MSADTLEICHADEVMLRMDGNSDSPVSLGRGEGVDVDLSGKGRLMSRHHAHIERMGSVWWYVDQESTHGSFMGGRRVRKEAIVDGLEIVVGDCPLRFNVSCDEAPKAKTELNRAHLQLRYDLGRLLVESLNLRRLQEEAPSDEALEERVRNAARSLVDESEECGSLSLEERDQLVEAISGDILRLGPLEPFIADDSVTEIMVVGPQKVYIEQDGEIRLSGAEFRDNHHLRTVIERIVTTVGRRVDESSPLVDARLKDGSRVNAVISPIAPESTGAILTIRKFGKDVFSAEKLIGYGSITETMAKFLETCVAARLNVVVSGGTGSGKTSLLNALSRFIGASERIVTIEDALELNLQQEHVVPLEARPANTQGEGEVSIRALVRNSLRMRPDRIVVGECRGGEALDMLQAMNTGHDGSLTTVHANSPHDALSRLETLVLMAGMELPLRAVQHQIYSAVDLIVQTSRMMDHSRKVVSITEIAKDEHRRPIMDEHGNPKLVEVFAYEQTGLERPQEEGGVSLKGKHNPIQMPTFAARLRRSGFELPDEWFKQERPLPDAAE